MSDKTKFDSMKSTIRTLKTLAFNIHGVMDMVDCENCDGLIAMCDNAKEYRWHNIQENKDDLPTEYGEYECWCRYSASDNYKNEKLGYGMIDIDSIPMPNKRVSDNNTGFGDWYDDNFTNVDNLYEVKAWRKIEPYNG